MKIVVSGRNRLSHLLRRVSPQARAGEQDVLLGRRRRVGRRIVWVLVAWVAFRAFWVLAVPYSGTLITAYWLCGTRPRG